MVLFFFLVNLEKYISIIRPCTTQHKCTRRKTTINDKRYFMLSTFKKKDWSLGRIRFSHARYHIGFAERSRKHVIQINKLNAKTQDD